MALLPTARIILGIAAAVAPRRTYHYALAFSTRAQNVGTTSRSIIRRGGSATASAVAAAANKEICETTVSDQGRAEVLCTVPDDEGGDKRSSLWSDVAIAAAKQFTITQRKKLKELGALDIERPIRIVGEPVTGNYGLGDCTIDYDDDTSITGSSEEIIPSSLSSSSSGATTTKIIHFQRHGQGYHNLICDMWRELGRPIDFDSSDPNLNPVVRPEFLDPPLTALGMQQCTSQRDLCASLSPELVIVSPMLRCIQTARLSFRDHHDVDGNVPWLSHEGCREELGLLVGNKRRSIEDIRADYPEIDFSPIEHNEDVLWEEYGDRRETLLEKSERIYEFLTEFVRHRPEGEIAIVCHSAYLFTLLNAVMDIDDEQLRSWFLTSEVRSLRISFTPKDE